MLPNLRVRFSEENIMQPVRSLSTLPLPVRRALRKLGADLAASRKRRRITMSLMAERVMTTRQTIAPPT